MKMTKLRLRVSNRGEPKREITMTLKTLTSMYAPALLTQVVCTPQYAWGTFGQPASTPAV